MIQHFHNCIKISAAASSGAAASFALNAVGVSASPGTYTPIFGGGSQAFAAAGINPNCKDKEVLTVTIDPTKTGFTYTCTANTKTAATICQKATSQTPKIGNWSH